MFSVPLRRALVTGSDLPYPEGVAAAEVLKVGFGSIGGVEENAKGLAAIVAGSIASAGFALLAAMRLAGGELATAFRLGGGTASGASISLSMALIGVGHLVGMTVGIAMLAGMLIAWVVLVPVLTSIQGVGADVAATVNDVFRNQVRFIGAGTIGVAAVWTLLKIIGPIVAGIRSAMAASAARASGEVLALKRVSRQPLIESAHATVYRVRGAAAHDSACRIRRHARTHPRVEYPDRSGDIDVNAARTVEPPRIVVQ